MIPDLTTRTHLWHNPSVPLREFPDDGLRIIGYRDPRRWHRRVFIGVLIAALVVALVSVARADDGECWSDGGCTAWLPSPSGTRTFVFKKGDKICECAGWIWDKGPASGWRDCSLAETIFLPGTAPAGR